MVGKAAGRFASCVFAHPTARCTSLAPNSFSQHEKVFSETGATPSRNSARRRRHRFAVGGAIVTPADVCRPSFQSGDVSMSKRFALLSAVAFSALAISASVIVPATAEDKKMMKSELSGEKTVMVGGAAMFPSKNIIQNAVNSKDHTTLVAAVKAAGLVETLEGKVPFTVFAPTNAAFGK